MPFEYPLVFPSRIPNQMTVRMHSTAAGSESPFTGAEQIYVHPRQKWELSMQFPPLRREHAEELIALFGMLNGREGSFIAGDTVSRKPRGVLPASAAVVVAGAGQTGSTLAVSGLPVSTQKVLLPGDYLQLGTGATTRLHKVLQTINTGPAGTGTLDIWPRLRYSPADGAPVVFYNPKGNWRLTSNVNEWTIQLAQRFSLTVDAAENMVFS